MTVTVTVADDVVDSVYSGPSAGNGREHHNLKFSNGHANGIRDHLHYY